MKIAYFDCFAGIAGDMALGALLDCGVPLEKLREGLSSLPIEGWSIDAQPVLKSGIHALKVNITLHGVSDSDELAQLHAAPSEPHAHNHSHHDHSHHGHSHSHEHSHGHAHDHHDEHHSHEASSHSHEHHHGHEHSHEEHHHDEHHHSHEHSHEHPHVHGRSMREIRGIIESSALDARVKKWSLDIFGSIARVEAKMHHSTPDDVHFHEIGGLDSLLDICGVAWCLHYLGVEEIHCSALPMSTGYVDCAHGRMPVPAPATLELLKGAPLFPTEIVGEMITPTGAGIVATLSRGFGAMPAMTPQHIGFGGGTKNWPDRPNLLRVVIGEKAQTPHSSTRIASLEENASENAGLEWKTLSLVETNIDDMNPELFDHVFARLFEIGAADVWLLPLQMKKNRPAQMLGVLCQPAQQEAVVSTILRETTTLGVRVSHIRRAALPREAREVQTPWGRVRVKAALWPEGQVQRVAPEYDDVKRVASESGVSAREVYATAQNLAQQQLSVDA